jgi:TPR repeat protein
VTVHHTYAHLLLTSDGIQMNKSLAARHFKLSADQEDDEGQMLYGNVLLQSEPIESGDDDGIFGVRGS